ncbi:MAG: hypothetical protein ABJA76_14760 [Mucilaginibacter sp.]
MELDELRDMWTKSTTQPTTINYNITELIYRDANGPLATLEKKFKAALYIFPLVLLLFGGTFISNGANQSVITWLLFSILFIEFLFSLFNYITIKQIQQPTGNIKDNLLKRFFLLQQRSHNYLYLHVGLYMLMAVLLELSIHFNFDTSHNWWGHIAPVLRMAIIVMFLTAQLFIKRHSQKQMYGQYIDKLNELIGQME